jgi:sugar phosphate isomerase/epimerase
MPRPRKTGPKDIELIPDAWPRFERMVKAIAKAGPQHREAPPPKRIKPAPRKKLGKIAKATAAKS